MLERKIGRYRPSIVALVGVTLYRAIAPLLAQDEDAGPAPRRARPAGASRPAVGLQRERVHGARLFVLPNPSGRNANFSYAEMLAAFRQLKRTIARGAG